MAPTSHTKTDEHNPFDEKKRVRSIERRGDLVDEIVSHVPNDAMKPGIRSYLLYGERPGRFLNAVLTNNFYQAATSADSTNAGLLKEWGQFLYTYMPQKVWGDETTVFEFQGLEL